MHLARILQTITMIVTLFFGGDLHSAPVRVASFNVKYGIDSGSDYEATKAILARIDADIVAFQELRTSTISNWENLARELGYDFRIHNTENASRAGNMWLGYFSRFPIIETLTVNSTSPAHEMSRLPLKAVIRVPGGKNPLALWNLHHKSGGNDGDQFRRAIEAHRVRQNIASHLNSNPSQNEFVVLGDMNDDIRSQSQRPQFTSIPADVLSSFILGSDISFPVSYAIFPNNPYSSAGGGMHRLTAYQQGTSDPDTYPSWNSLLDYIFVSSALQNNPLGPPLAEVYNSQRDVSTGGIGLPKVLPIPPVAASGNSSDHLAIFADFNMADAPAPGFAIPDPSDFRPVRTWGSELGIVQTTYGLQNNKTSNLQWFAATPASWVDASPASGTVGPGGVAQTTISLNQRALSLPPGQHATEILFTDAETGSLIVREVILEVIEADFLVQTPIAGAATTNSTFTFQGLMGPALTNGMAWFNRSNGMSGMIPPGSPWTASIPLAYGSNFIDFRTSIYDTLLRANDGPTNSAYSSAWASGSNGGTGFGPWELGRLNDGWGGHALFGSTVFNVPASFGGAFSLWASGEGSSTAQRDFSRPLTTADTFMIQFDNNWIEPGKSVGFALADSNGTKRMEFYFVGFEMNYRIRDAAGERVTSLGYTDQGMEISIQLTGTDDYILTTRNTTISGTLAPGGQVSRLIASNRGSGGATAYDLYLGRIQISDSSGIWASDSPVDSAYSNGWTNGSRGGFGLGSWVLEKVSYEGRAGHLPFTTSTPNVPPSFGGALSVWANGNGIGTAKRKFLQPLASGDAFLLQFDTNLVLPGKKVGFSLADENGTPRFEFSYIGGNANYTVSDAIAGRDTAIPYTQAGLELRIELTSTNTYRLSANGNQTLSGTLGTGGSIEGFSVENNGSGLGTAYDLFLGAMRVESKTLQREVLVEAPILVREVDPLNSTDGLPNEWWMQHFGTLQGVSATMDNDNDGFSNGEEFRLGTHPLNASSSFRVHNPVFADGRFTIEWDAVAGKTYQLLGSPSLSAPDWKPIGNYLTAPETGRRSMDHEPGDQGRYFYRIQLVP